MSPVAEEARKLLARFIGKCADHPLLAHRREMPWQLTRGVCAIVAAHITELGTNYRVAGDIAVHATASIETGAIVKGPAIVGPRCFIAATAYLRGGVFLDEDCIIGPGAELKSSFIFKGSKLAHLNFVGDSILGEGVNCEAGSIVANYRNEREDNRIGIAFEGGTGEIRSPPRQSRALGRQRGHRARSFDPPRNDRSSPRTHRPASAAGGMKRDG